MKARHYIKKFWYIWTAVILVLINIAGIFLVVALFAREANDFELVKRLKAPVNATKRAADILFIPASLGGSELSHYNLIIGQKEYEQLLTNLPEPNTGQVLTDEYKQEVPAKFIHNGIEYNVDVRFRGEGDVHWGHTKKSWRIEFPKDNYFQGFRELHLIVPHDRGYIVEEFNQYRARELGLTVPESEFVTMSVNGQGPMAYWQVEGWNNDFLERHQKPSDANLYNTDIQNIQLLDGFVLYPSLSELTSFSKAVQDKSRMLDNFSEVDQWTRLLALESDEEFYKRFAELVDMEQFYKWNAHGLLAGSRHGERTNLRLYFDNTKGKFELIPWNIAQSVHSKTLDESHQRFVSRVLTNPEYIHERNKILFKYINEEDKLETDIDYYEDIWDDVASALYADRVKVESNIDMRSTIKERKNEIVQNFETVEDVLGKARVTVEARVPTTESRVLAALTLTADSFSSSLWRTLRVEFGDAGGTDLELFRDVNGNGELDTTDSYITDLVYIDEERKSEARNMGIMLHPGRVMLPEPDNRLVPSPESYQYIIVSPSRDAFVVNDIDFRMSNAVTGEKFDPVVRVVNESIFAGIDRFDITEQEFTHQFPFAQIHNRTVVIQSGVHQVNETMIVPDAYTLTILPGTILEMAPNTSIYSRGTITARGTNKQPIIIRAQNPDKPWGILLSSNTEALNEFDHISLSGGSSDYLNGIFSRGMLSVFHGDADIRNSTFVGAFADDAVNVKNGNVVLLDSVFKDNPFDAFDGDFVTGEISGNEFRDNGNDGVDISGSDGLVIADNLFARNGDKAISVGEASSPVIFNNAIIENNVGVASKDSSDPLIINNVLYRNTTNISVYLKKQLFGGAHARIYNSILWGATNNFDVGPFSSIDAQYSSVEGGATGEGNQEIIPEFAANYTTTNPEFNGKGNTEILQDIGILEDSVPIGIIE